MSSITELTDYDNINCTIRCRSDVSSHESDTSRFTSDVNFHESDTSIFTSDGNAHDTSIFTSDINAHNSGTIISTSDINAHDNGTIISTSDVSSHESCTVISTSDISSHESCNVISTSDVNSHMSGIFRSTSNINAFENTLEKLHSNIIEIDDGCEQNDTDTKSSLFDVEVCAFYGHGQQRKGVEEGPYHLCEHTTNVFGLTKHCLITPTYDGTNASEPWQSDYQVLYDYLKSTKSYILLGGDHSIGMSSVASSIYKTPNIDDLYVIWIDAHADTNTMEASVTKNIHGQPLAGIMGYEKPWFPIKETLPMTNLLYFGIRDLDEFESVVIEHNNVFYTSDLQIMLTKLENIMKNNSNAVFHVSFDVDALDSEIMTSTGCVVRDGLSTNDVSSVINFVKSKMIAFDLVEFNPNLGDKEKSLDSIKQIIDAIK